MWSSSIHCIQYRVDNVTLILVAFTAACILKLHASEKKTLNTKGRPCLFISLWGFAYVYTYSCRSSGGCPSKTVSSPQHYQTKTEEEGERGGGFKEWESIHQICMYLLAPINNSNNKIVRGNSSPGQMRVTCRNGQRTETIRLCKYE